MLKSLAISLVLANAAYLAWSHGWLYPFGLLPPPWPQTEPARIDQQLHPEYMRIVREAKPQHTATPAPAEANGPSQPTTQPPTQPETVADATVASPLTTGNDGTPSTASAPPPKAATRCLQLANVLSDRQFASLREALKGNLPDNAWDVSTTVQPARWIVYSGKLPSVDALAARKAELRQLQVDYRDVSVAALQPGLALGTYSTEGGALQALKDVTKAGVKGAKVVVERPEATLYTVKLPEANDALQSRFEQLTSRMSPDLLKNKALQPCP